MLKTTVQDIDIMYIIPKTLATNVHKTQTLRDVRSENNKLIKWDSNTPLSSRKKEDRTDLFNRVCVKMRTQI